MAKKKVSRKAKAATSVNKSKAVRDYYEAHPNAKPKDVVEGLARKGIKLNATYVSVVRSNSKKLKGATKRPGRPASKTTASRKGQATLSVDDLLKVKEVVEELGGIEEAQAALTALEKLSR